MTIESTQTESTPTTTTTTAPLTNGSAAKARTMVPVTPEFWEELKQISKTKSISTDQLISQIDEHKQGSNLSSAIRLYILNHIRSS